MELSINEFYKVSNLFSELDHHISIKGVLNGQIAGRVFSDREFTSAVVLSPQGIFIGGDPLNKSFLRQMNLVVRSDILPYLDQKGQLDYVVFYPQSELFDNAVDLMFEDCHTMKDIRMTLSNDMSDVSPVLPDEIHAVGKELLSCSDMPGLGGVLEEISGAWPSTDDFCQRGFGCVAVKDGSIIGWCLTDWVVGEECEVGIETYPSFRKQGYGKKLASTMLALAKEKGIRRTGWQCWIDNTGSVATAKAAGFKLVQEFTVRFAWANPLNNMLINGNYYMLGRKRLNISSDYARSARSYAQSLDQGWDWGGNPTLYWNCACMFYKSGEVQRAQHYYTKAIQKGWQGIDPHIGNPYVYQGSDSNDIKNRLEKAAV
jgi:GNAT superfamily N-acetyltransferase